MAALLRGRAVAALRERGSARRRPLPAPGLRCPCPWARGSAAPRGGDWLWTHTITDSVRLERASESSESNLGPIAARSLSATSGLSLNSSGDGDSITPLAAHPNVSPLFTTGKGRPASPCRLGRAEQPPWSPCKSQSCFGAAEI